MKGILNTYVKTAHDGKWKSRYWKWGISIAVLCLITVLFFNTFITARATTVDVLNGTGSFDNTTETGTWKLFNNTGTSIWGLDTSTYANGPGAGMLQSPSGRNISYDSYVYYRFTTTADMPVSATLDLAYRKAYYNAQPSSGNWNVIAEIWKVGGSSALQTITINNGNSNVNWTNLSTKTVTAITQANTQYELRLRTSGITGSTYNSSPYVKTWFDNVVLNVTYQATPPSVTSATAVSDHTVNVVFNESVDKTTAESKSNYSISPNLNITSAALQADGKTVQLITDTQINGTIYTVSVNNVKDTSGNIMTTAGTATFTGIDSTPPQVSNVSAANINIANVVFNEAVDTATAQNIANYSISPSLAITKAVLQSDSKTVVLTTANQISGANYIVTVTNVKDTSGNIISSYNTGTFVGFDSTPPTILKNNIINDTTVDVTFSKLLDSATAQNAANYIINPVLTVNSATLQSDGMTVRLVTGKQTKGTSYTITVKNVKDNKGNVIVANSNTSFVGIDTTPPTVKTASSVDNTTVNIQFSEPVDSVTAQSIVNYSISPSLTVNNAVLQPDGVTVRITTAAQTGGSNYTITTINIKDTSGNLIAGNTATFTGTSVNITYPIVSSLNSIGSSQVIVIFSKPMDSTTTQNIANYTISPSLAINNAVLQADGITVILTTATQVSGTTYTLNVNNVKDTSGYLISSTANKGTFTYTQLSSSGSPHANFMNETDKCAGCHNSHAAKGARLEIAAVQTDLCFLCHDAGGQSKYDVQTEFGGSTPKTSHHRILEGTQQCTDCHNPHGATDSNGNIVPSLLQNSLNRSVTGGNQFCLTCHQTAQGSTSPINPTTFPADGIGHNKSTISPTSGTNIRCEGCHEKHASDLPKLLKKNANGDATVATGDNATFCAECHQSASTDGRYQGYTIYNNNTYSKHSLTTSTNTNTSFPGVNGQAGQCQNCHDPHGSAYGTSQVSMKTLRDSYTDEVTNYTINDFKFCFNCHNSTSQNNKYDIQTQYTDKGTTKGGHYIKDAGGKLAVGSKVPCEDCHSIHGSANNNKYMMKDSLGSNLGDGRNECLACHTTGKVVEGLTMQAPPSGVPQHTDNVTPCLNCHGTPHQPTLGVSTGGTDCSGCHSNIVTGMKNSTSGYHHLMVNTLPNYLTGANKNCLSCHVDHNKFNANGQKSFNLKQNFTQSFPTSDQTSTEALNSDFNPNDTTYGGICLSCHKDKQTKTYTQPSGNSETPAISVTGFTNSAHNYTAQSAFGDNSAFNADCSKCHNDSMTKDKQVSVNKFSVHDSTYQSILSPFNDSTMPVVMNEKFCYKCHDGSGTKDYYQVATMSAGSKAVYTDFNSSTNVSKHPLGTKGLTCVSCHDPHTAKNGTGQTDKLGNVAGLNINWSALNTAGINWSNWNTNISQYTGNTTYFSLAPLQSTDFQSQLCFKCHTAYSYGSSPAGYNTPSGTFKETDIAKEFNPNNKARHDVTGGPSPMSNWTYQDGTTTRHYGDAGFINGWSWNSTLKCTDCHGQQEGTANASNGPHGSTNPFMLARPWKAQNQGTGYRSTDSNDLCFKCHSYNYYTGKISGSSSTRSAYSGSEGSNLHSKHESGKGWCAACHGGSPHGWKNTDSTGTYGVPLAGQDEGAPYANGAAMKSISTSANRAPGQWNNQHSGTSCGSIVLGCT